MPPSICRIDCSGRNLASSQNDLHTGAAPKPAVAASVGRLQEHQTIEASADGLAGIRWINSVTEEAVMRGTLIPLPDFLDAAIRACAVASSSGKWYLGVVVVLDRKAERRSRLLDELVREGSSINDVTRRDLLVAIPGTQQDWRPGVDEWVLDPHKRWEDAVGAPGLFMSGADPGIWASYLWELVSNEVERCQSPEDVDAHLKFPRPAH